MDSIEIPGWFLVLVSIFGSGWLMWMIYLTKMVNQAKEDNAVANKQDIQILQDITNLNLKLDESKKDFHTSISSVNDKLTTLMGDFQYMKGMLSNNTGMAPVK